MPGVKCSSDPKCAELARHFLADVDGGGISEADIAALSVAIQDAAENWIAMQPNKPEQVAKCPACGASISLTGRQVGEAVRCCSCLEWSRVNGRK